MKMFLPCKISLPKSNACMDRKAISIIIKLFYSSLQKETMSSEKLALSCCYLYFDSLCLCIGLVM